MKSQGLIPDRRNTITLGGNDGRRQEKACKDEDCCLWIDLNDSKRGAHRNLHFRDGLKHTRSYRQVKVNP